MISRATQPAASASRAADTENLNTDVMRFMAILGLCLAAIFALVQSVPMRPADEPPARPRGDAEPPEAVRERTRLMELRKEISRLSEQTRKTRQQNQSATRTLALTRERLTVATDQASRLRRERAQMESELRELNRQLQHRRSELDEVRKTLRQRSDSPAAPEHLRTAQQEQPDRIPAPLEAPRPQHQPMVHDKPLEPARPPAPLPAGKGFTLRFASGGVLEHMVSRGTVSLYGMVDKQAWRLSLPAGRPGFTPDAFPARYHEMTRETVPSAYRRALERTPGVAKGNAVIWGVRLPAQTERAIGDLTRNLQGGDLVIRSDGKVYLNEEAPGDLGRER